MQIFLIFMYFAKFKHEMLIKKIMTTYVFLMFFNYHGNKILGALY